MKNQISIKVNIVDKIFPLKVDLEDEARVRKAARFVNEKIKTYQSEFGLSDKEMLLSMCALQMATDLIKEKESIENGGEEISEAVQRIDDILNEII